MFSPPPSHTFDSKSGRPTPHFPTFGRQQHQLRKLLEVGGELKLKLSEVKQAVVRLRLPPENLLPSHCMSGFSLTAQFKFKFHQFNFSFLNLKHSVSSLVRAPPLCFSPNLYSYCPTCKFQTYQKMVTVCLPTRPTKLARLQFGEHSAAIAIKLGAS